MSQASSESTSNVMVSEAFTKSTPLAPSDIAQDLSRNDLLTEVGKLTLKNQYLLPGEDFQDMFARVAAFYGDNLQHAQRLYDYMSKQWFMPATPILSNGGSARGLPISCFLNSTDDSLHSIVETWNENVWLASNGGGIGTYWGHVRSIGENVGISGQTSGIIPFVKVMDSLTLAISQGSLRRGNAAVYLDIHHPEIEEFLEIRKPAGDFNRKCLNLHHAINITDAFMHAVHEDQDFDLLSPKTQQKVRTVNARELFQKILETRLQTGEPYLIFIDTVNRAFSPHQKTLGMNVKMSNLCSEIFLSTGKDHLNNERTAVCCLSSVNMMTWDDWHHNSLFIKDVLRFLDNVLQDFIDHAPSQMHRAKYSAMRERSVGLGLMGFHSFLQMKSIPFSSVLSKSWNLKVFNHLKLEADKASVEIALRKGSCPDAEDCQVVQRFSHKLAVAPTASISVICGGTSAGIEPIPANIYNHKTLSGNFVVKNRPLQKILQTKGLDNDDVWHSILEKEGSVQHLDFLTDDEKNIFKTAFEIDQRWIIDLASDRAPLICQGQSTNLFLTSDCEKHELLMLHYSAWSKGLKSLYYLRSKSIQRPELTGESISQSSVPAANNFEECLSCQ